MSEREELLEEAVRSSDRALTAWMHYFAPEFCEEENVEKSRKLVEESGGILAFIADILLKNSEALGSVDTEG